MPFPTLEGIRDLRDVRISLEGLATEKAAALIAPDEIDQLEVIMKICLLRSLKGVTKRICQAIGLFIGRSTKQQSPT